MINPLPSLKRSDQNQLLYSKMPEIKRQPVELFERKPSQDWIEVGYNDKNWKIGFWWFRTKWNGSHVRTVWNIKIFG